MNVHDPPPTHITELPPHQIWARLREAPIGRLAVCVDGRPEIFPLNHVVDHASLVFRTASGTKTDALPNAAVAYEADGEDLADGAVWSVVIHGIAREITGLHDSLEAGDLPLLPWHGGSKPRIFRIEPETLTGRSFHPVHYRDD